MADYSMMAGGPVGLLPQEEEPKGLLDRIASGINKAYSDPGTRRGLTSMGMALMDAAGPRPIGQRMNTGQMLARGFAGYQQGKDAYAQEAARRQDALLKQAALAQKMQGDQGGPFGDSMQARAWDVVLKAQQNPALTQTPEYAAAVAIIERPNVMQGPEGAIDMTQRLPERFQRPGAAMPQGGQQQAPAQPQGGPQVIQGTEKLSADQKEYDKAFEPLRGLQAEFKDYAEALDQYGGQYGMFGKGIGDYDPEAEQILQSRHKSLQLQLKSPQLFQLGVLAGPDMDILNGFLPDPTDIEALIKSGGPEKAERKLRAGYNEAARYINNKIDAYNARWEGSPVKQKELPRLQMLPARGGANAGQGGRESGGAVSTPEQAQAAGWTLMTDGAGNRAYVGPDNQVIEVQ